MTIIHEIVKDGEVVATSETYLDSSIQDLLMANDYEIRDINMPSYALWQRIEKFHIDERCSDERWEKFVETNQNAYAEECSRLSRKLYDDYSKWY